MSKNEISESLNKGVPLFAPVYIRFNDLLEACDNKKNVSEVIGNAFSKYMDFLRGFGKSIDMEFFQTMMVAIDENTLERKLIFSPSAFFSSLAYNLNYQKVCSNADSLNPIYASSLESFTSNPRAIFGERLDCLKNVKSAEELRKEFPMLYQKYVNRINYINDLKQLFVRLNNKNMNREMKKQLIKQVNSQFKKTNPGFNLEKEINSANAFNLSVFTNEYHETISSLVDNAEKIVGYLFNTPIPLDGIQKVGKKKLELFLAYQFLKCAEDAQGDSKQDYLYYVTNYFADNKHVFDSNISIVVGKNTSGIKGLNVKNAKGIVLTPEDLYERYRNILIDNPNLRAIDFSHLDFNGLTATEVKKFMNEYLNDLAANWDFLPPDNRSYEEETLQKIRNSGEGMSEEDRARHQERLLELFMEKKNLYDSSDPFFRVKGKDTFDGYIGYIYSNGRVVLDKFYDDADNGKLADGHAVYAMDIQDFYTISKLSKTDIIRNKLCKRYIHKGDWAKRVLEQEIEASAMRDPSVDVKQLIKKGDMTSPDGSITN